MLSNQIKWGLLLALTSWALPAYPADLTKPYTALCAKEYDTAASLLAATLKVEPKNSMARRYFAAALTGLQKPERALLELRAAQAIDGQQSCDAAIEFSARVGLARLAISRGEIDKARKIYQFLATQKTTRAGAAELRSLSQELNQTQSPAPAPTQPTAVSMKG